MGTKAESPKLSSAERLARKRAAARLRQQRCRARKRQAMLEKKRGEIVRERCVKLTHDLSIPTAVIHSIQRRPQSLFPTYKSMRSAQGESWTRIRGKGISRQLHKSPSEPIYNCVSFDSQKSLEDAHPKILSLSSSPPGSPSQKPPVVVTPSRTPPPGKQASVVRVSLEKKIEDALVPEEEAAVVAMLSLKSGRKNPSQKCQDESKQPPYSSSHSPPREVMISRKPSTHASAGPGGMYLDEIYHEQRKYNQSIRHHQQRRIAPRRIEAYNYGQSMKIAPHSRRPPVPPGYYRVHAPVPPPHAHYARCYYPPAPRYISYDYE